jgi:site-specific DNA recombinase
MYEEIQPRTAAIVYVRRSQDRQDRQVLSVDGQLTKTRALIKELKLKPIVMPSEEVTASKPGRKIFNLMMDKVNSGEARYIVCWKANRLARNARDAGTIIQAMDDGKLLAVITDRGIYHNTPRDKHSLWDELGDSKKFSDDLSKDVRDGYERKYERGEYPSEAFTGYVNVKYDRHNRSIAPCPRNAPKFRETAQRAMSGLYTLNEVYRFAVSIGLETPRGNIVSRTVVQEMLRRRAYTGVFWHGGAWRNGSYEPLLSQDEFDKIQVAMGWAGKRRKRQAHKHNYAYKVMRCSGCGYSVTAYPKKKRLKSGKDAVYSYYVCSKKSKTVACRQPQINEVDVESQVMDYVSRVSLTKDEASSCLELVRKFSEQDAPALDKVDYWLERRKQANKAIDEFSDLLGEGKMSRERYERLTTKHFQTIEVADSKTTAYTSNAARQLELTTKFFEGALNIVDTFKKANPSERIEFLIELGSNWELDNKKVLFTPRKPYDFLVNRTSNNSLKTDWRARPDSNRRSSP